MSNKITIDSNCPEFGYELLSVLPYAYKLYQDGLLKETISGFDTKSLYFFSPKHIEINKERSWDNVVTLKNRNFPNIEIHQKELDWSKFSPPPLKDFYSKKSIKFEKETIVIFNRYNKEWGNEPINYLDITTIDKLFELLSEKYQIVYLNLNHDDRYFDHYKPLEFNDIKVLEKYPNVLTFKKLQNKYPNLTLNELQLRIFSNCEKYISSNGGQLILSAYFGGENIIFSKKTRELDPKVNSFFRWYYKLGGGVFHHVDTNDSLIEMVKQKWVDKKPLINILIRTSERPIYFKDCINSIYNQTYKNINIIVGFDTKNSEDYVLKEKCRQIKHDYSNISEYPKPPNSGEEYGKFFIPNLYMNDLQEQVKDGYIMYIDDDDVFQDKDSLMTIVNNIKTPDDILFWKVKFIHKVIPSDNLFGKPPALSQIDTVGFMFPNKYKVQWEAFTNGDYRVAKKLYDVVPNKIYINSILTTSQRDVRKGRGIRDDKKILQMLDNIKLSIIIPTFSNVSFLPECFESILKSIKDLDCEILVGIDGCNETLNYLKNKQFDKRFKFYFFEKNIGPYVIKNTLVTKSSSNNILFFDSDDIMLEDMVPEALHVLSKNKFYKPMYIDFKNKNDVKVTSLTKSNKYGEGVFAIDRETFLSFNGFEGWRCAADSDLMGRLYSKNISFSFGKMVSFLRRIHPNSLTVKPETNYSSKMRAHYYGLSKKKRPNGVCDILSTSECKPITITYIKDPIQEKFESRKKEVDIVLGSILNLKNKKPETSVDYGKINEIISKKGVYNVNSSIKPVRQNTPKDRNELMNLKKGNVTEQMNKMFPVKPNRRGDSPNIFSNTKKNR